MKIKIDCFMRIAKNILLALKNIIENFEANSNEKKLLVHFVDNLS